MVGKWGDSGEEGFWKVSLVSPVVRDGSPQSAMIAVYRFRFSQLE